LLILLIYPLKYLTLNFKKNYYFFKNILKNIFLDENILISSPKKFSIIYLPKEEEKYVVKKKLIKRNNSKIIQQNEIFTRMRSICARMPILKRKRTPKPGSPESLVAFLCSNTNIF
jgi:hypothetical protein